MSAYFIVSVTVGEGDREMYDQYILRVKPIVESFGGEYLVRTENISAWSDKWSPDRVIVLRFENREALDKCFSSPEYAEVRDLRINSVDARAIIVDGLV